MPEEANVASGASVAGNKMQWNVIKNLSQMRDVEIHHEQRFHMIKKYFVKVKKQKL